MVEIQSFTTKEPIKLIGMEAGICYGSNTSDEDKNFKRGKGCINSNHGRTLEFPDVYMVIDGYSAKVIREFYTHIGGAPTRLQASTRYIDYTKDFHYIIPPKIEHDPGAARIYNDAVINIINAVTTLQNLGVEKEDASMLLPFAMQTKIVCKMNLRTLISMSRQRLCARAFWEYRKLFHEIMDALSKYSEEWSMVVDAMFYPKCEDYGYCPEAHGCGMNPPKKEVKE